jgi:hypothetical protein
MKKMESFWYSTARCVDLSSDCVDADESSCYRPPDDHSEQNVLLLRFFDDINI